MDTGFALPMRTLWIVDYFLHVCSVDIVFVSYLHLLDTGLSLVVVSGMRLTKQIPGSRSHIDALQPHDLVL